MATEWVLEMYWALNGSQWGNKWKGVEVQKETAGPSEKREQQKQ